MAVCGRQRAHFASSQSETKPSRGKGDSFSGWDEKVLGGRESAQGSKCQHTPESFRRIFHVLFKRAWHASSLPLQGTRHSPAPVVLFLALTHVLNRPPTPARRVSTLVPVGARACWCGHRVWFCAVRLQIRGRWAMSWKMRLFFLLVSIICGNR